MLDDTIYYIFIWHLSDADIIWNIAVDLLIQMYSKVILSSSFCFMIVL